MNEHTRTLFLSRMSDYQCPEGNVLDATIRVNISPRIPISITAPTKRQILDAKSHVEQQIGIKLAEKLF